MAGNDRVAYQFAEQYTPAAETAYKAFRTATLALGGTSLGLTQTINNHLAADHYSRADGSGAAPPAYPAHQVETSFAAAEPPSVTGFDWAPNLVGPHLPGVPNKIASWFASRPEWPQGNPDRLDRASNAWRVAAQEVDRVASWLNWTTSTILDPANNAEYAAIGTYWATLYKPADPTTVLSGLSILCHNLANACHEYASAVREAYKIVTAESWAEIIALLATDAAAAVLARILRPTLARVTAILIRALTRIGGEWITTDIIAAATRAIANTRTVKAVQATFNKIAGRELEKELDEAKTFANSTLAKSARNGQERGEFYEGYLQDRLGGEGGFKHANRQFDGKHFDAQGEVWYEAKSGGFWDALLENKKLYNSFLSKTGNQQQLARDAGVRFEVISERSIPESIANWLTSRGIPYRVIE